MMSGRLATSPAGGHVSALVWQHQHISAHRACPVNSFWLQGDCYISCMLLGITYSRAQRHASMAHMHFRWPYFLKSSMHICRAALDYTPA